MHLSYFACAKDYETPSQIQNGTENLFVISQILKSVTLKGHLQGTEGTMGKPTALLENGYSWVCYEKNSMTFAGIK